MVKLVNLTPHTIVVVDKDEYVLEIPPSGIVARISSRQKEVRTMMVSHLMGPDETGEMMTHVMTIPVVKTFYEIIEGLPEPEDGTVYIVSSLVRSQLVV